MTFKANHKSVVAIGGFNPTILTPDFLHNYCSFRSDHKPLGRTTPVLAEIKYGNVHFLMELSKFQIMLDQIDNFEDTYPIDIIINYLKVLEYTPLALLGVNFNYSLSDINEPGLRDALKDPFLLEKTFHITPTSVLLSVTKPDGQGLLLNELTITHQLNSNVKNSIKITFTDDSVTINDNYEVSALDKDREKIQIITADYSEFVENNRTLIKQIRDI